MAASVSADRAPSPREGQEAGQVGPNTVALNLANAMVGLMALTPAERAMVMQQLPAKLNGMAFGQRSELGQYLYQISMPLRSTMPRR